MPRIPQEHDSTPWRLVSVYPRQTHVLFSKNGPVESECKLGVGLGDTIEIPHKISYSLMGATSNYFNPMPRIPQEHDSTPQRLVSVYHRQATRVSFAKNGPVESECNLNNVNPHIIRNQYQIQNKMEVTSNEDRYCKLCHYQTNTEFLYSIQISSESPMEYSRRPTKNIPKENQLKILNRIYQTYFVSPTYSPPLGSLLNNVNRQQIGQYSVTQNNINILSKSNKSGTGYQSNKFYALLPESHILFASHIPKTTWRSNEHMVHSAKALKSFNYTITF